MVTSNHIGGREVLRDLEGTLQRARRESQHLKSQLGELDQMMRESVEGREDALLDLAKHYLPRFDRETVLRTFVGIRDELLEVLSRKERRQQELQQEWDSLLDQRQQLDFNLEAVTDQLNDLVSQREDLEERVAERLQQNEDFRSLTDQIVVADRELARNEERVAEIQKETAEKLPSYKKSRLFQYLSQQQYGTPQYNEKGLIRRWDRWISNLIDYPRARRGYDFLRVTPELMTAEVNRRRQSLLVLMERAQVMEDQCADALGLTEVLARGDAVGAQRDALVDEMETHAQRSEAVKNELVALEGNQNEFYEQAVQRLKQFLGSMEESALAARARTTPEVQDDRILDDIQRWSDRLDQAHEQSGSLHRQFRTSEVRLSGLEQVLRRFRSEEFDSTRSLFAAGFDFSRLFERYVDGDVNAEALWSAIRQHQQFAPSWHERSAEGAGDLMDSEFSYVLMRALAEVANQAMRNASYRGTGGSGPSFPSRRSLPRSPSAPAARPRPRRGGFTSGRGF